MKALHLKSRSGWWYYQRRRPQVYADVEPRLIIHFSLKTQELGQARLKAAQISLQLDEQWREAKARGVSLKSLNTAERFKAATAVQQEHGFEPKSAETFTDQDLIDRLRQLLQEPQQEETQKAVLGMVEQPKLSFDQALDLFWAHIEDEWIGLSHDQQRSKKNIYLRSIRNFELAVGQIDLHELERKHAHSFRSWWLKRLTEKGLKPHTGNKEITSLRRLVSVIFDIQGIDRDNPFARVRLKEDVQVTRVPVTLSKFSKCSRRKPYPRCTQTFICWFGSSLTLACALLKLLA